MTNFDLKILNLADGDYEITVVAKASGYKDSPPSNAVSYVVGSGETITDLTGYTWVGNDSSIDVYDLNSNTFNLSFVSNDQSFTTMRFEWSSPTFQYLYYGDVIACSGLVSWGHTNTAYKTIQITGGADATNAELIAWLQENGTLTKTVVEETYIISAGTYTFKECIYTGLDGDSQSTQNITFTSNGTTYNEMTIKHYYDSVWKTEVYYGDAIVSLYEDYEGEYDNSWYNESYRTISITTAQTVEKDFYDWFIENATKQ